MNAIILRSDLRCTKHSEARIIEYKPAGKPTEYHCDKCKAVVKPVPREHYVTHGR